MIFDAEKLTGLFEPLGLPWKKWVEKNINKKITRYKEIIKNFITVSQNKIMPKDKFLYENWKELINNSHMNYNLKNQ